MPKFLKQSATTLSALVGFDKNVPLRTHLSSGCNDYGRHSSISAVCFVGGGSFSDLIHRPIVEQTTPRVIEEFSVYFVANAVYHRPVYRI